MNRVFRLVGLIFSLIGAVFICVGGIVGVTTGQFRNGETIAVDGEIVSFDQGKPVVRYEVDGETYFLRASTTSTSMHVGGSYPLRIDPARPDEPIDRGLMLLVIVFGGMGGLFFVIGVVLLIVDRRSLRRREELLTTGLRTAAEVVETRVNYSIRVNGRRPVNVIATCRNPVTSETQTLASHAVWNRNFYAGQQVDIYFDPLDPNKFAFDIPEDKP